MKTNYARGLEAEKFAALALLLKGWWPVCLRYKTPLGEIDLVVKRLRTLAFVEVKRRASDGAAAEAITAKNRARVRNAAALYLQKHPEYNGFETRFDAVTVAPLSWPRHIPRAWE
jgi:putative endonuclease